MMKTKFSIFFTVALFLCAMGTSSCSTRKFQTMREPNVRVDLQRADFVLSPQLTAEARTVRVFFIDWHRVFKTNKGSIGTPALSIPVMGGLLPTPTQSYALYLLMQNNAGYDVVFYPQFEIKVRRPFLGVGFFYRATTTKVTARLGALTND
jgi:hypothetical protein